MNKFSAGDIVVVKKDINAHSSHVAFQVKTILDGIPLIEMYGTIYDGKVEVFEGPQLSRPGTRGWREGLQRFQVDELFSLEEAKQEQLRLEAIHNHLEKEFSAVSDKVKEKFNQAAALVKEAEALIKPMDKTFYNMKTEAMSLYRALEAGGWSHSHMSC